MAAETRAAEAASSRDTLRVTPPEARALEILDALCRGRSSRVRSRPPELLRPELIELGARRMAVTCLQFLRDASGCEDRQVLRSGRRARGRLWDPGFADEFKLRFTAASLDLWRQLDGRVTQFVFGRGRLLKSADHAAEIINSIR